MKRESFFETTLREGAGMKLRGTKELKLGRKLFSHSAGGSCIHMVGKITTTTTDY